MTLKKLTPVVIASLLALSINFTGASQAQAKVKTLKISIVSEDFKAYGPEETGLINNCYAGKYSTLDKGQAVKVKNSSGKTLALGRTAWKLFNIHDDGPEENPRFRWEADCALIAQVKKIPKTSIYEITVGNKDAGSYTYEELNEMNWQLELGI